MSSTIAAPAPPHDGRAATSAAEVIPQLEETWGPEPGLLGWLRSVDHKSIATRYFVTAMVFFLLGGL